MFGGVSCILRKQTYTCTQTSLDADTWIDVCKLFFSSLIVGPFRLLNEITNKFFFLGIDIQSVVLDYAMFLSLGCGGLFLLTDVVLDHSVGFVNPFVAFISAGLIGAFHYFLKKDTWLLTKFTLFEVEDEIDIKPPIEFDELSETVDTINLDKAAKDGVGSIDFGVAASVNFDDSLTSFITDPDELLSLQVHSVAYSDAADARNLETILREETGKNAVKFDVNSYGATKARDNVDNSAQAMQDALAQLEQLSNTFGNVQVTM